MTSGINWNNYTSTQIMQMYNMGIQVPSDVLAKANTTASQNFETDDDVIRESADIELEEFMNSSEYSDAKLKEQVEMLGEAQEEKYKSAFEASKTIDEITSSASTIETAINDRVAVLEAKIAEMYNGDGEITDDMRNEYNKAAADIQNLAGGTTTRTDEIKDLNEKAIIAETFAEKAGEKADKLLTNRAIWKGVGAVFTLGFTLIKGKYVKMAEHVSERSDHIISESQGFQSKADDTLKRMKTVATNAGNFIQQYNNSASDDKG